LTRPLSDSTLTHGSHMPLHACTLLRPLRRPSLRERWWTVGTTICSELSLTRAVLAQPSTTTTTTTTIITTPSCHTVSPQKNHADSRDVIRIDNNKKSTRSIIRLEILLAQITSRMKPRKRESKKNTTAANVKCACASVTQNVGRAERDIEALKINSRVR
jgi:hypothetical protein